MQKPPLPSPRGSRTAHTSPRFGQFRLTGAILFAVGLIFVIAGANAPGSAASGTTYQVFLPLVSKPATIVANAPWPMEGHDVSRSGRSPYAGPPAAHPGWQAPNPNPSQWTFLFTSSSPVVAPDGTIYFVTISDLVALNPSGTIKWTFTMGKQGDTAPSLGPDGTIYVTDADTLYAVNANGTLKWQQSGGLVTPIPSADGTIYSRMGDSLTARASSGNLKWQYPITAPTSVAVGPDGSIYVCSTDHSLYALTSSGAFKWKFTTQDMLQASPSVGPDGVIYVGSNDSYVYAINPNGTLKWKYQTGGLVRATPAIASDGTVYVGSSDTNLYALQSNGTLKWKFTDGGDMFLSNAIVGNDGTVYIGPTNGDAVYALNPNGTVKWQYPLPWSTDSPAVSADGVLYVPIGGNSPLIAFDP